MASLIQLNQFTASIFDLEYKSKDLSLHVIWKEIKRKANTIIETQGNKHTSGVVYVTCLSKTAYLEESTSTGSVFILC